MYSNGSHGEGTCVLLEIPSTYTLVQYYQGLYRNKDMYELEGVHIANYEVFFFQAILNIVVYQMLIVTNVPVNITVL